MTHATNLNMARGRKAVLSRIYQDIKKAYEESGILVIVAVGDTVERVHIHMYQRKGKGAQNDPFFTGPNFSRPGSDGTNGLVIYPQCGLRCWLVGVYVLYCNVIHITLLDRMYHTPYDRKLDRCESTVESILLSILLRSPYQIGDIMPTDHC